MHKKTVSVILLALLVIGIIIPIFSIPTSSDSEADLDHALPEFPENTEVNVFQTASASPMPETSISPQSKNIQYTTYQSGESTSSDEKIIEAEDSSVVTRIGGNYHVGDPDEEGWMVYNTSLKQTCLFTLGHHNEKLKFEFTGTDLAVQFFCFRSGIASVTIDGGVPVLIDTFSGDLWEWRALGVNVARNLELKKHSVELEATGQQNSSSSANYLYVDLFSYGTNLRPVVGIVNAAYNTIVNQQFNWTFAADDPDGCVTEYGWDFEGGTEPIRSSTTLPVPQPIIRANQMHTYTEPGKYTLKFWAKDNKQAYSSTTNVVYVEDLPDLEVYPCDIRFIYQEGLYISVTTRNTRSVDIKNSLSYEVNDTTAGIVLQRNEGLSINAHSELTFQTKWNSPTENHTITVEIDARHEIGELDETNNIASRVFTANKPTITKITPYYAGFPLPVTGFTSVETNLLSMKVKFVPTIDDLDGIQTISNVTFIVNGNQKYVNTTFPFSYEFDVARDQIFHAGANTVSAIAYDPVFASAQKDYTIFLVPVPQWLLNFQGLGGLSIKFETTSLTFSIEYTKKFFDNMKKGPDYPVVGGENGVNASVTVGVGLSVDGKTSLSGKGEIKGILFKKEAKGSISITGTLSAELWTGTLSLEKAVINVHLELTAFEIPYKIPVPVLGDQGLTITGTPHLDVDVEFGLVNNEFKPTNLKIGVGGGLEAKIEFGDKDLEKPFATGLKLYAFVDGTLYGQYPESPLFSVDVSFGCGGEGRIAGQGGKIEIKYEWSWPSHEKEYVGNVTWMPLKANGSDLAYGTNFVFSNLDFDDCPSVAYDSQGKALMVYVGNSTTYQKSDIYYVFWNASGWSTPRAIWNNSNYEMNPVVAFDSNNNAMAIWTYDKNNTLNQDSTLDSFLSTMKDLEIYYSFWNKSTQEWTTPLPLTNDAQTDGMPSLCAGRNGFLMATWIHDYDGNDTTRADRDIFYSEWNGNGWSQPKALAILNEADFNPDVSYDSQNNAVAVWVHDTNSSSSVYFDQPPTIMSQDVSPNPASVGQNITISANVTDDDGVSLVKALIGGTDETTLMYNTTSGLYEGSFVPSVPGTFEIRLLVNDTSNQQDQAIITVDIDPPMPPKPYLRNVNANPGVLYLGEELLISVLVSSNEPLTEVSCEIAYPNGFAEKKYLSGMPSGIYTVAFDNTHQTGTYEILLFARNVFGNMDHARITIVVLPPTGDKEIYYSTWNRIAWSPPTALTDNYVEDNSPSVAFDSSDRPIMTWERSDGYTHTIYYEVNFGVETKLTDQLWALEPVLAVENDLAMITWRAYPNDWGDLYYLVFNTTFGGYDIGPIQRITDNEITDWKPSVALHTGTALVIWLKHRTTIDGSYTTYSVKQNYTTYTYTRLVNFTMSYDDDDPYYVFIPILPDLAVDPLDISFSDDSPSVDTPVLINATVHNKGDIHVINNQILVEFFDGDPAENGSLINAQVISLMAGANKTLHTIWTPTKWGVHDIYVRVDGPGMILEGNEKNNVASNALQALILVGNRTDRIEMTLGNVTIVHENTVSVHIGPSVKAVFTGSGLGDNLFIEGKNTIIANVSGTITLVSALPPIQNISLTHHGPLLVTVSDHVEVSMEYGARNDKILVPSMLSNREIIVDHSGPVLVKVQNGSVVMRLLGTETDSVSIFPLDASLNLGHSEPLTVAIANVTDPQLLESGTNTPHSIGKFVYVSTADTFDWAEIKIHYEEQELSGIDESQLRMFSWNPASRRWTLIPNSGVNTTGNYVWANVTQFSVFTATEATTAAHDIAAANIKPTKTVVGQNYSCSVNVTVTNHGSSGETFKVTLHANSTSIAAHNVTLQSGASTTIAFTWNTSGFARGNYTIWAYAWPVPGETENTDNTFTYGIVKISIPGDINADGTVNIVDVTLAATAYQSKPGYQSWNANADADENQFINIVDIVAIAKEFGKRA